MTWQYCYFYSVLLEAIQGISNVVFCQFNYGLHVALEYAEDVTAIPLLRLQPHWYSHLAMWISPKGGLNRHVRLYTQAVIWFHGLLRMLYFVLL